MNNVFHYGGVLFLSFLNGFPFVMAGDDRLEVVARDFRVINTRGERLFAANRQEVVVGADILRVSGK